METPHKADLERIKTILEKHVKYTGSAKGKAILDNFDSYAAHFKKIIPGDYKKILSCIAKYEGQGCDPEEAKLKAFNEIIAG